MAVIGHKFGCVCEFVTQQQKPSAVSVSDFLVQNMFFGYRYTLPERPYAAKTR